LFQSQTLEPVVEVASHVIEVELHVYIYHLIEKAGYNLHKVRNPIFDDYTKEPTESLDIVLTKQNGEVVQKTNERIPQSYTDCVDFYILDLPKPVFFPSYLCHTLSPNGAFSFCYIKGKRCVCVSVFVL
jgi:hypothetical protein